MIYRIVHRTEYRYASAVSSSYGELYLLPRHVPGQVCRSSNVSIQPEPYDYRERLDFYGNRVAYFAVLEPHAHLAVVAESTVEVEPSASAPLGGDQTWEIVRDRLRLDVSEDAFEARGFLLESPKVELAPAVAAYAGPSFPSGRPLMEAVTSLMSRIHSDFGYKPGATSVGTTLTELLERREGVCQDFTHLAVGCLRSVGLAGRYVSGYLDTAPGRRPASGAASEAASEAESARASGRAAAAGPAAGPATDGVVGADVSHAWPAVFVPGAGWVGFDPTNNRLVCDRYITNAYGRDYGDVSPLKGVIYTESKRNELQVSVEVAPVEGAG